MFLFATTAFAMETDLAAMSVEELRQLRSEIEAELISRGASDEDLIYKGVYTVGKDIEEGAYILSFDGAIDTVRATVTCFQTDEERKQFISDISTSPKSTSDVVPLSRMYLAKGEEGFISLKNDTVLTIGSTFRIRPAENEIWRP